MAINILHRILRGRVTPVAAMTVAAAGLSVLFGALAVNAAAAGTETKQKKESAETATRTAAMRTLDAVNIEGEIAVPQVLFITSRDYPRYRDGLRWRYRMSTADVGRSIDLPTRLRVSVKTVMYKEEGK